MKKWDVNDEKIETLQVLINYGFKTRIYLLKDRLANYL